MKVIVIKNLKCLKMYVLLCNLSMFMTSTNNKKNLNYAECSL